MRHRVLSIVATGYLLSLVQTQVLQAQSNGDAEYKAAFLKLCDLAAEQINNPERQKPKPVPFYQDSYAVRALCVAYDLTGNERYLQTCKAWSDRMIEYQNQMTPKGAYFMNYNRQPGASEGQWYVADSSSIAMGILATAVRCSGADKEKYLASGKEFSGLVTKNYIGEAGGIMNGLWSKYAGEWWCSSGIFGSLASLLGAETRDDSLREVGVGAVNWLNHLELSTVKFGYWKDGAPAVVMYVLEAYSAGMPQVNKDRKLREETVAKLAKMFEWMADNQASAGGAGKWDYNSQWGSKLGGLPFHMYVLSPYLPEPQRWREAADKELRYIGQIISKDTSGKLSQLMCFAMISYAERVSPGALYRASR